MGGTHARCTLRQDARHVTRTVALVGASRWFLRWCVTPRPGAVAADGAAAATAFNKTHEAAAGISKKTTHKCILRSLQVKNHSLALLYGSALTVELNDDEAAAGKQARPAFERRRRF